MRLCQEILLGIGGVRLLRALDIAPTVWHANEGHSAFLTFERIRELVQKGLVPRRGQRAGPTEHRLYHSYACSGRT